MTNPAFRFAAIAWSATFFWFQGAVLVLPFGRLESAAVGIEFLVHARHAAGGETISLRPHCLGVRELAIDEGTN